MLSVKPSLDVFIFRIDVVKDGICINLMRCCEYNDLKVLIGLLKTFHDVRSNVDACVNSLFIWKVNLKDDIRILSFYIVHTMDQSFVHIKNHQLFLLVWELRRW